MACPLPVVTVKRALEEADGEPIQVLLDDGPPRENVYRFVANRGYSITEQSEADCYLLHIDGIKRDVIPVAKVAGAGQTVVLITSDRLGDGPDELGRLLMKNFIITLLDLDDVPGRILFLNSGIMLTTSGSEVVEALVKLGNMGTEILSCGVCLDYFNRREKLEAGLVTNMFTIIESMQQAGKVIRL